MQDGLCVDRKAVLPLRSCPEANHSGLLCTEQMCTNYCEKYTFIIHFLGHPLKNQDVVVLQLVM
jgi:hypothetical protein